MGEGEGGEGVCCVSQQEMVDRIKAAVDARTDDNFVIMARTDALAVEGFDAALEQLDHTKQVCHFSSKTLD